MPNSVQERFIAKIKAFKPVDRVRGIRASVYTTYNEIWLCVLYSGGTKQGKYWYGIDTHNVETWTTRSRVLFCFICGDENIVVFIPDDKLLQWYKGVNPNRKGQWMVNLIPTAGKLSLQVSGHQKFDVTDFVNRYDFISKTIPPPTAQPLISKSRVSASLEDVTRAIMDSPSITGDSLHDRMCDIVFQIGKWMGYVPAKGYKIQPDSPYEIDVVWLNRDLLEVAVEIQIGGNETEAKDRLIHANRFGARKIVVVSSPESINRFKSLCRYEPVLKNWLEIWSIPRVYDMYVSGEKFFGSYSLFERRQWADDVREVL